MTVRENKVYQLTEELQLAQEELKLANEVSNQSQLKNQELTDSNEFLSTEVERLHHVSNELNETRQKLSTVVKEKEELWIKGSLNAYLTAKAQQLANENDQLRKQIEDLTERLASMQKFVNELHSNLNTKDKSISDLSNKLDVLAKVKKESTDEQEKHEKLRSDEIKQLNSENARLRANLTSEKQRADEAEKNCELLELMHVENMKSVYSAIKPTVKGTVPVKDQKPNKSSVSNHQVFSELPGGDSNLNLMRGHPLKPMTQVTVFRRKIGHVFKKLSYLI